MRHRLLCAAMVCASPLLAQVGAPGGPVPTQLLNARRQAVLDSLPQGVMVVESVR